jgi:hypothetical protein
MGALQDHAAFLAAFDDTRCSVRIAVAQWSDFLSGFSTVRRHPVPRACGARSAFRKAPRTPRKVTRFLSWISWLERGTSNGPRSGRTELKYRPCLSWRFIPQWADPCKRRRGIHGREHDTPRIPALRACIRATRWKGQFVQGSMVAIDESHSHRAWCCQPASSTEKKLR